LYGDLFEAELGSAREGETLGDWGGRSRGGINASAPGREVICFWTGRGSQGVNSTRWCIDYLPGHAESVAGVSSHVI
jgi:hypothetical protein